MGVQYQILLTPAANGCTPTSLNAFTFISRSKFTNKIHFPSPILVSSQPRRRLSDNTRPTTLPRRCCRKQPSRLRRRCYAMDSASSSDSEWTVEIDPDGDVLLAVGPSEDSHVLLLVSSKVLSLASPVFRAMFGPYFKEGQALREEKYVLSRPEPIPAPLTIGCRNPAKPLQLPLPDDDLSGVTILCNYLHHRHLSLPKSPSLDLVVGVARVADKYDCTAILRPVVAAWMRPYLFKASAEPQLRDLLALACLFDDAWSFKTVTAQILLANGKNFGYLRNGKLSHAIPESVFGKPGNSFVSARMLQPCANNA